MRLAAAAVAAGFVIAALPAVAAAQLADLQPGRNFVAETAFGSGRTEGIEGGDADVDGDLDVVTANGGDTLPQLPRIFINDGAGAFADETATRFAGILAQKSRDIEFVDVEDDGDLDLLIANDSNPSGGGAVSRFFVNLGGRQAGAVGFFEEATDGFWGALVGVPAADQLCGGCNSGPFRDWSCDCDFGDLDDDGDQDLFFSTYGPAVSGLRDSRVFLNDGVGLFNEVWPWADPAADTKLHTFNMDLVDLDGDFDLDVFASSRNSQSRAYTNHLYGPPSATPFRDVTQAALVATGAVSFGTSVYDSEFADVDGDGDFDVWMDNYNGNTDRLLRNNGPGPSGFTFTQMNAWIQGDPVKDEENTNFGDYDNDGDLDVFKPSFAGTNYLYQSSLAQGLDPDTQGVAHRTGLSPGLAPNPELPSNFNGGTSLEAEWLDADGDSDLDILLANDSNQGNWLFRNLLGVPDTHAPVLQAVSVQADKPNGSDTVIHAAVRDNAPMTLHRHYEAVLSYSVDGDAPQSIAMQSQGSQQYRGVIPAQVDAMVEYHVEVTDLAGNTGVSATHTFTQSGSSPWTDLGSGLAGVLGVPSLAGAGTLVAGSAGSLGLTDAKPSAICALFVSVVSTPAPFKCGTLVPVPVAIQLSLVTNGAGSLPLAWGSWPNGLSGISLYFQYAIADGAAVCGTSLSNALRADVP